MKLILAVLLWALTLSPPSRGAWIEISGWSSSLCPPWVAPLVGGVD